MTGKAGRGGGTPHGAADAVGGRRLQDQRGAAISAQTEAVRAQKTARGSLCSHTLRIAAIQAERGKIRSRAACWDGRRSRCRAQHPACARLPQPRAGSCPMWAAFNLGAESQWGLHPSRGALGPLPAPARQQEPFHAFAVLCTSLLIPSLQGKHEL